MAKQKDGKEDGVQALRLPRLLWDSRQIAKLFGLTFQIYKMGVKEVTLVTVEFLKQLCIAMWQSLQILMIFK